MVPKIQVLVGMIASGKSTYCRNAAKAGAIIVNDDDIVNLVHADDYTLYNKDLKILYKSTENHIVSAALSVGRQVVVDRGLNLSLDGRRRWLALGGSFDVPVEALEFKIQDVETHARRRMASDPRGRDMAYWLGVAKIHLSGYVQPSLAEGFSAVHQIDFSEIKEGKVI